MSESNLDSWLGISQSISLEQLEKDFSNIITKPEELIPLFTKKKNIWSGKFIEYNGMRTTYLGAFTTREEESGCGVLNTYFLSRKNLVR